MTEIPTLRLSNGGTLPSVGFGTFSVQGADAPATIASALDAGYRLIDSAAMYGNEAEVGEGVQRSSVARDEIVVTTKIGKRTSGAIDARANVDVALEQLGMDHIDVLLIHGPNNDPLLAVDTWRGLLEMQAEGRLTTVGVSNFSPAQLTRLHAETGVWPAINQVQVSPALQRREQVAFHLEHGIVTEAWSPLGVEHDVLEHPVMRGIAEKHAEHGATPALVALRWGLQRGHVVIPRSSSPERQRENLRAVDLALDDDDMRAIAKLDVGTESDWEARGYAAW